MSLNVVTLLYLVASVCFIQALKGLSHPTTSIRGNVFGMAGMAIAALTTCALIVKLLGSYQLSPPIGLAGCCSASSSAARYGAWRARRVEMTAMPELVAFLHSHDRPGGGVHRRRRGRRAVRVRHRRAAAPGARSTRSRPATGSS